MIKRILVGLGGTDYTRSAVHHAVALALAHDAELTGVCVLDESRLTRVGPVPLGAGTYAKDLAGDRMVKAQEHVEWASKEFVDACTAAGVRHELLRERDDPLRLLIDHARYHDLMVFGLRSLFEFDLVQDPHDALVRLVQAGVRPLLAVAKEIHPVRKVLVAYSGSMESAKAMKRFVQMRLWPDLQLRIVSFEDGGRPTRQMLCDAERYCRAHGMAVESESVPGPSKELVLRYAAAWGADLLVVGNSAKSLLLRRLFGETALHVIRHAERPLFLAQ